jgi:hypothetical protein
LQLEVFSWSGNIAYNVYQLCEGWAFEIRQPNLCTEAL